MLSPPIQDGIIVEGGAHPAQRLLPLDDPSSSSSAHSAAAREPGPSEETAGPSSSKAKPTTTAGTTTAGAKKSKPKSIPDKRGRRGVVGDGDGDGHARRPPPTNDSSPAPLPYSVDEFPQLALDDDVDHSDLATSFRRPIFDVDDIVPVSRALMIAYSHRESAARSRKRAQRRKNAILAEYEELRDRMIEKKLELSLSNDEVTMHNRLVGAWTKKVFDLELDEPCEWKDGYERLRRYRDVHGRLPPSVKKAKDDEERFVSAWLHQIRCQKGQDDKDDDDDDGDDGDGDDDDDDEQQRPKKKRQIATATRKKAEIGDYPHRIELLAELGVVFESRAREDRWETMFQRLLAYREEQGTLRFPSDDQCAATRDPELIELQKWVKGQVLAYRYGRKRNTDAVRRLTDIGFDFDKWYAKPGKAKGEKKEEEEKKKGSRGAATTSDEVDAEEAAEGDVEDGDVEDAKMPAILGVADEDADIVEMADV